MTEAGKSGLALLMADGSAVPRYCGTGTGSGTALNTNNDLVAEAGSRADYSDRDATIQKQVTWTYDFNSIQMSGLDLTEFGQYSGSLTGSVFMRESFPAIEFDGTNELQVQITLKHT